MAKAIKTKSQPPKKQANTGGSLGDIWTGPKSQDPGVLKAKADKAKRDSVADSYKKKKK